MWRWKNLQIPYKIEIFSRDFTFKGFSVIEKPDFSMDYLTVEKTTVRTNPIEADKGDFVMISSGTNREYYGIIDDLEPDLGGVTLTLKPLLSLFDTKVRWNRSASCVIEEFIAGIIEENFINSGDDLQNIPGLAVSVTSETAAVLNLEEDIGEFYSVITAALTGYGVVVDFSFDPQSRTANAVIGKNNATAIVEADLPNVIGASFLIGDSGGQLNKLTVINENDPEEKLTFFLHTDGSVSTENADRIFPVFFSFRTIDPGENEFSAEAYAAAFSDLAPQKYDNLIEITINTENKLIDPNMSIGTEAQIFYEHRAYISVLTGFERSDNRVKLVFGCVRAELTKRLILERRKKA